jgi:C-terminal processing protease CtpA/Prc
MKFIKYLDATIMILIFASLCSADTVYLKTGHNIEGHIEKEYKDKIEIITSTGEFEIEKEEIEEVKYDTSSENYLKLAEAFMQQEKYKKAVIYYNKALLSNPDFKGAKEGLKKAEEFIKKQAQQLKEARIARKKKLESLETKVKDDLGLVLEKISEGLRVKEVIKETLADLAGLQEEDIIIKINKKSVDGLRKEEYLLLLSEYQSCKLNLALFRIIDVPTEKIIAGSKKTEGIGVYLMKNDEKIKIDEVLKDTPAWQKGIRAGDIIVKVNGEDVRGYSLNRIKQLRENKNEIQVTILRNVTINKKRVNLEL